MKEPLYLQALSFSWQLVKKNKFLWIFGFFASFLGQMGLLEFFTKVGLATSDYALYPAWLALPRLFGYSASVTDPIVMPADAWVWFICLLLIIVGFALFLVFTSVVSQGALIKSAAMSMRRDLPDVGRTWHTGVKHFWPLFFINLIKKAVIVVLAVAVGWATLNAVAGATAWDMILFLLVFLLASLIGMVLSFLVIYAAGYVVIEKYPFGKSLLSAWRLFVGHWLVSIEIGLIVLVLNVALGLVALLGFFVLFFPTIITWFVAILTLNSALWLAGLIVGTVLFLAFTIFIGSLFTVFTTSVWTYLFMKMHRTGLKSWLLGWMGR